MIISWHGYSCISVEGKGKGTDVLLDPFSPQGGVLKRAGESIVVITIPTSGRPGRESSSREGQQRVLDRPGEYDIGGVAIRLLTAERDPLRFIVLVVLDGIILLHCAGLSRPVPPALLEQLEHVDVLTLPVGGGDGLSAKDAAALARELEPRLVIPLRYRTSAHHDSSLQPLDPFLKEIAAASPAPEKRAKISKEDLRDSQLRLLILDDA